MSRFASLRTAIGTFAVVTLSLAPLLTATSAEAQMRRGGAACGPRGCAAVGNRGGAAVVRRPAGVVVGNPNRYWRPGGAIAAGAAIGFVAGATAVAIAGQPPKSGQCWYYTSPAKTSGFWDVCPR